MIEEDLLRVSFTLVRLSAFVANALVVGLLPLLLFVLRPGFLSAGAAAWLDGRRDLALRLEGLMRAALVASAVATVLGLLLQTALVSSLDGGDINLASFENVLETSFGLWNLIRLPIIGALAMLLVTRLEEVSLNGLADGEKRVGPAYWVAWGVLGVALLATWSFAGHAAVSKPVWAAIPNDVVHLVAGATWLAGIMVIAVALPEAWRGRGADDRTRMLWEVVSRFSRLALIAIAVIAATGTLNSFFNLEAPSDLVDSGYGRTLAFKIGLFLIIVVLGGVNHYFVRARLRKATRGQGGDPYGLFRQTIAAELVVGLLLMGSTGLLIGLERTKETALGPAAAVSAEELRLPS